MPQIIPIQKQIPSLVQRRTLDGAKYVLHVQWNMRSGWYLGLSDSDDNPIFSPRKLVTGVDMLVTVRWDARCPPGVLMLSDMTLIGREPGYLDLASGTTLQDLQGTHALLYWSIDEL